MASVYEPRQVKVVNTTFEQILLARMTKIVVNYDMKIEVFGHTFKHKSLFVPFRFSAGNRLQRPKT